MRRQLTLGGDATATPAKARFLLTVAKNEVKALKTDTAPLDRARLREAAEKGWKAASAGADAFLCATQGKSAVNHRDVLGVYKTLGVEGPATRAYDHLHVSCGYEDRKYCSRASVTDALHALDGALRTVAHRLSRSRLHGKARKTCEVP